MNERIKILRNTLGLTQKEFGERIGVKQTSVAGWENTLRNPTQAIVKAMCHEFNVNEIWLRTGTGEMFASISRDEQIALFMGDVLKGKPDFRRRLIGILSDMTSEEWKILEKYVLKLAEECKNGIDEDEDQK